MLYIQQHGRSMWLVAGISRNGYIQKDSIFIGIVYALHPTGQTVKQKTAGSEEGVCFGWTRPGRFSRKRYGFFPAECVVPRDWRHGRLLATVWPKQLSVPLGNHIRAAKVAILRMNPRGEERLGWDCLYPSQSLCMTFDFSELGAVVESLLIRFLEGIFVKIFDKF